MHCVGSTEIYLLASLGGHSKLFKRVWIVAFSSLGHGHLANYKSDREYGPFGNQFANDVLDRPNCLLGCDSLGLFWAHSQQRGIQIGIQSIGTRSARSAVLMRSA